jgi:AcrR family transcriptional regulator
MGDQSPILYEEQLVARFREDERENEKSGTRQKLLEAAVVEFSREGFDSANINRISEAAGLGKGTVYNYFPSKRDLMLAAIVEVSDLHQHYIREQVVAVEDPLQRLKKFYAAGFAFVETYPFQSRFLIGTMYGSNLEFKKAIYKEYVWMGRLVGSEILEFGKGKGYFQTADPSVTASLLMTLYLGSVAVVDENGKPIIGADDLYQFVLRSIQNQVEKREL